MHSDNEMVNLRSVIETLCYMVDDDSDGVEEIMQLPTIDLVRCRDCKHSPKNTKEIPLHDSCYTFNPDDFCSYGEREGK